MGATSSHSLRPWIGLVSLHSDVVSEEFSEDIFALDLGPLADGLNSVPAVYRDPEQFFKASYLTSGLRSLLEDVLSRLSGGSGNRVLKLMTPFGGGKSHTLAALLHAARSREALDVLSEGGSLPRPDGVRTAVFDGQFFDAATGKAVPGGGFRARTLWGWLGWSLGGQQGYELFRTQDEARVAPGADELLALLGDGPNLILLDEALNYLISAGGVKVEQTTLRDETLAFLQRLTAAVANTTNSVLVFSLQSSKRESLEYIGLLQTVDHLAARKDQRREPVEPNEVLAVIQRRLLARAPGTAESSPAAAAFQEIITQMRQAYAQSASERHQAQQEGILLRDRVRAAFPFHPALIDLMRERWAAIPDFQRTRGALRFLAACLRACHREQRSRALLGPGEVPMHDSEVRLAFFKEVGQQVDFQAVLEHDLVGVNSRARRIDERRAKEDPREALRQPAVRMATAILMYSFGGLRRDGAHAGEVLPPGVAEAELLAVCVGPDLDSTTALACLKELREQCLYLHYDGVRYCFKKDPNVTLLLEQEAEAVGRDERRVRQRIKEMLEERLAGRREAVVWPEKSFEIPDEEPAFLIAYLPLEFREQPAESQEQAAREYFESYGDRPRRFRNGLALAVASQDQIETLRRSVRYLLAAEQVKSKAKPLNLTDDQKGQLRERESTERGAAESALLKLYTEVWFPRADGGGLGIEKVSVGGRPLTTTVDAQKRAKVHERVIELIAGLHRRVFNSVAPGKIVELFRLGEGVPPRLGIHTREVLEGFYSFLGFPRLLGADALRAAVARGIAERVFAYAAGPAPELGADGKYAVGAGKVRLGVDIAADEIDVESGFVILPQAVPEPAPPVIPGPAAPAGESSGSGGTPVVEGGPSPSGRGAPAAGAVERAFDVEFSADRKKLYAAWNALANLADLAGEVRISVHAESASGLDRAKLQNGVIEPLREAELME
jgi:hypothetical protein